MKEQEDSINQEKAADSPYTMQISRLVVDKLGVKLYDKASAVIAELIANSYDADATLAIVEAPMGEYLARKDKGLVTDCGYSIQVKDNGHGMTPEEANKHYLIVGGDRRSDQSRGDKSRDFGRKVMGRKGVGKLSPFGICKNIEVISCGGEPITVNQETGYMTAHFTLNRDDIFNYNSESPYSPSPGDKDGTLSKEKGTTIILRNFDRRRVPELENLSRQIAQRFGVKSHNWSISLVDNLKPSGDDSRSTTVGEFSVEHLPGTKLILDGQSIRSDGGETILDQGNNPLSSGFTLDEIFYPVTGWMGRAKINYKDDLMAGVRIYCRGKIAAQTPVFNLKSGFTGEFDIRSYLTGELHADWLDENEDLIQTDRQDILWSDDIGQAFEKFGQSLVKKIGKLSEKPRKESAWAKFADRTKINEKVKAAYPRSEQADIRKNSMEIAQIFAKSARESDLRHSEYQDSVIQLSLLFGPHMTLDQKLKEATEHKQHTISAITELMKTARVAELSSFGRVAEKRVGVVRELEKLSDSDGKVEADLQKLIERSPWLVDPRWSPISQNQSFTTFVRNFQTFYKKHAKEEILLGVEENSNKRPNFVLASHDSRLELIEIKKPKHKFNDGDAARLINYFQYLESFFENDLNKQLISMFPRQYRITTVCDGLAVVDFSKKNTLNHFENLEKARFINWPSFLMNAVQAHQDFLDEFKRLNDLAKRSDT